MKRLTVQLGVCEASREWRGSYNTGCAAICGPIDGVIRRRILGKAWSVCSKIWHNTARRIS